MASPRQTNREDFTREGLAVDGAAVVVSRSGWRRGLAYARAPKAG